MPAYYADTIVHFMELAPNDVENRLIRGYESDRYKDLIVSQITAWRAQIEALKRLFTPAFVAKYSAQDWGLAMEFVIPRKRGRIDTVILLGDAIVCLEFKTEYADSSAANQIEDYSLDLLYFHQPSHGREIYPVVVTEKDVRLPLRRKVTFEDLSPTKFTNVANLESLLAEISGRHQANPQISVTSGDLGEYHPVPTIVEAAIGMFSDMRVTDIAKADSDPINLSKTIATIRALVTNGAASHQKLVCFVTGVPGAGKTLAGLKLVHDQELRDAVASDSVFLTGNLPLVRVLREALKQDIRQRRKNGLRLATRDPETTIDTILGYKKAHTGSLNPPHENIVVFDEAQRAWDADRTSEYLGIDAVQWVGYSEPALLLAILDRQPWAAIIALVGGGQEINRGEAGLSEWGRALSEKFPHWKIAVSEQALKGDYGAGSKLFVSGVQDEMQVSVVSNLHLDNPTRQFRGKTIALWTESLLRGNTSECQRIIAENSQYPVFVTQKLEEAKHWLRSIAKGTERYGCIASSEAKRLRAEGLELPPARADGVEHWFLKPAGDIRSSFQLEVAANEFQIQGLEVDYACVCWGGDFLRGTSSWILKRLRGTVWQQIGDPTAREYVVNSYRVLLTRARKGMVLFVPPGDSTDCTRPEAPFEQTYKFLCECGARPLNRAWL